VLSGEHPFDGVSLGVALQFPGSDLGLESFAIANAAVEALAAQHADLDLDHVEPGGVFWSVAKLQTPQDAVRLGCREGLERAPGEWVDRLSSTTRIRSALGQ
jgi:hypothetical protein